MPYLAQKMPVEMIAKLFQVDDRTIKRWAQHPDVRKALGEVGEAIVESTKATGESLVAKAFATLAELLSDAEDERVRLEASKTVLDRFGYPVRTETTGANGGPLSGPPVQIVIAPAEAYRLASSAIEGSASAVVLPSAVAGALPPGADEGGE